MTLCYSDVETREALRRLKEVAMTFGCDDRNKSFEISDVQLIQQFITFLRERETKRAKWKGQSPQVSRQHNHYMHIHAYTQKYNILDNLRNIC